RRARDRKLAQFVAAETWSVLNPHVSRNARRWRTALIFGALAFSVLAAARPLWGTRERLIRERGIDIIAAIDVSASMLAADIKPNRLEQAKNRLRQVLSSFPGQRIGIEPFAGDAFLQCPLTVDYGIAMDVLMGLRPNVIGTPGTSVARAIEAAREAFRESGVGTRVLILITDGEDLEGGTLEQAALAADESIIIYTLGIGSPEGAPIELEDGTFKEDENGSKIITRLDTETLAGVAQATGGKSYVARPGEVIDVAPMIAELSKLTKSDFAENERVVREERYQVPLAIALALLLLEGVVGDRRKARRVAAAAPSAGRIAA
ncbi:VWA domain-containing protein, partial [Candidatus Poribacteria bacterium]|nr:VWA domain-containing protein [Candidatus Poribacteria bacterium]